MFSDNFWNFEALKQWYIISFHGLNFNQISATSVSLKFNY